MLYCEVNGKRMITIHSTCMFTDQPYKLTILDLVNMFPSCIVQGNQNERKPKHGGRKQHVSSNTTKTSLNKVYDKTIFRQFPVSTV
jgi:hypothetical protein